jgi:hypothetical protein
VLDLVFSIEKSFTGKRFRALCEESLELSRDFVLAFGDFALSVRNTVRKKPITNNSGISEIRRFGPLGKRFPLERCEGKKSRAFQSRVESICRLTRMRVTSLGDNHEEAFD